MLQTTQLNHKENEIDEKWMKQAIEQAKLAEKAGGLPIGSVIVFQEDILAKGQSLVWPNKDPSAHGERLCISEACQKLQTIAIPECTLYTTLEPCSMCMATAGWASLGKVVFGAYQEDIPGNQYELKDYHAEEWGPRLVTMQGQKGVVVMGGVLRNECRALMAGITDWTPKS